MPLTGPQISRLAQLIARDWSQERLDTFASDHDFTTILGIQSVRNLSPNGSVFELASRVIGGLNSARPPRDRDLLKALVADGTPTMEEEARRLLEPPYFPSGDAHEAILLDRLAFVDRDPLRKALRRFTAATATSTRVLIVRGEGPSGKSYSWHFLHHLAVNLVGAIPQRLALKDTGYTPRQMFEEMFRLLDLDLSALPPMPDDPQLARIAPLVNAFKGKVAKLTTQYWLVIDDLNDPSVTLAMREAAYAMALAVEEIKPPALWVVLLGYNPAITASELRHIAREDARFPVSALVAAHLESIAKISPRPLPSEQAQTIAAGLFNQYPSLDKAAMNELMARIEQIGEDLKDGRWP